MHFRHISAKFCLKSIRNLFIITYQILIVPEKRGKARPRPPVSPPYMILSSPLLMTLFLIHLLLNIAIDKIKIVVGGPIASML